MVNHKPFPVADNAKKRVEQEYTLEAFEKKLNTFYTILADDISQQANKQKGV